MQLIYAFVFTHVKGRFSHGMAHIHLLVDVDFFCVYLSESCSDKQSLGFYLTLLYTLKGKANHGI